LNLQAAVLLGIFVFLVDRGHDIMATNKNNWCINKTYVLNVFVLVGGDTIERG